MSTTTAITIENHHVDKMPAWVNEEPKEPWTRRFYGQNELGEQMFLEVTPKRVRFTHGDCGWETYEFRSPDGGYLNYKLFVNSAHFLAEQRGWGLPRAFSEAKLFPFALVLQREECLFLAMGFSVGVRIVESAKLMEEKPEEKPVKKAGRRAVADPA